MKILFGLILCLIFQGIFLENSFAFVDSNVREFLENRVNQWPELYLPNFKLSDTSEDLIYPNCILQMAYDQSSVFHTISNTNNIGEGGTYIQGLQINNFRPMRSDSKIILEAHISHSESFVVSLGFLVNNQAVANLGSNSNSTNSNVTHFNGANDGNYLTQTSWKVEYTNPGAGRRMTINVGATASWSNDQTNYPLYINDRNSGDMRSISSITVYEIAQ
jgi:hypothetical protein